ncbi:MAG: cyclopropane-fatty-acyl-phospholipid synthase family protein [Immundisolibacter sp.]
MKHELALLERLLRVGTVDLELADGSRHCFGSGAPRASWVVHRPDTLRRIAANPQMALGETYMAGEWDAGPGELAVLLTVLLRNADELAAGAGRLRRLLGGLLQQWNRVQASYRNVAHHYDLDEWLFRQFLDREMYYSCAYFPRPDMSIEAAQQAKAEHIAGKLLLEPGMQVLDIGCGWGSLALHLAEHHQVRVTGVTLSRRQLEVARRSAAERGLADRVQFLLQDYREHAGRYDRIVSVGMFEHVGRPFYPRFFQQVAASLVKGGVALLHTICRLGPPGTTNGWVRKHIFPGGYCPALSELTDGIERSRLKVADLELLRRHYAFTLQAWQARFQQQRAAVAQRLGERFCRMWEFYLAASQASFEVGDLGVAQVQLATDIDAVPLTRDYLYRPRPTPAVLRRVG